MDRCIKPRLVRLTKLEPARRQIESAIWLWFVDDDHVSVHARAAAAHRLLRELAAIREEASWPYAGAYSPPPPPSREWIRATQSCSSNTQRRMRLTN